MGNIVEVAGMVLRGVSLSVIDLFFFMTVLMAFMTVYRFKQFSAIPVTMKGVRELVIELAVQGILVGILLSFVTVLGGLPIVYTDYLYFLLPMSFIIGFLHIRYTNLIYAAMALSVMGFALNGQQMGTTLLPTVTVSVPGLSLVTGLVMLLMGTLILRTGTRHMRPVIVHSQGHRKLGFGMQRFWPVPMALLAAVATTVGGDAVTMPGWWPMLKVAYEEPMTLFILPLLLVMSHGSISFSHTPKDQVKWQGCIQIVGGALLTVTGIIFADGGPDWMVLLVMAVIAISLELIWNLKETEQTCLYDLKEPGVYIVGVEEGSPAKKHGFRLGERITHINGAPIDNLAALTVVYKTTHEHRQITLARPGALDRQINPGRQDILSKDFGLTLLQDHPAKVFDYSRAINMNMMHLAFQRQKPE